MGLKVIGQTKRFSKRYKPGSPDPPPYPADFQETCKVPASLKTNALSQKAPWGNHLTFRLASVPESKMTAKMPSIYAVGYILSNPSLPRFQPSVDALTVKSSVMDHKVDKQGNQTEC